MCSASVTISCKILPTRSLSAVRNASTLKPSTRSASLAQAVISPEVSRRRNDSTLMFNALAACSWLIIRPCSHRRGSAGPNISFSKSVLSTISKGRRSPTQESRGPIGQSLRTLGSQRHLFTWTNASDKSRSPGKQSGCDFVARAFLLLLYVEQTQV
jgi:hypothetical protein